MKGPLVAAVALSLSLASITKAFAEDDAARLAIAMQMVDAWNQMEWERAWNLFSEDGVLHSVMIEPIVGRDDIAARLGALVKGLERIELQLVNSGVIGDVVVLERVDDFVYKGKHSRVPVVGVMEISNGHIDEWREYYDKASLEAALRPDSEPASKSLAKVVALTKRLSTDWNAGDMSGYLDAYHDGTPVSLLFRDQSLSNKQEIIDLFTSSWTTEEAMGDFETSDVQARAVGPDTIIAYGKFEHRFPHETVRGGFSHVWQRAGGGGWKIIHEHTSGSVAE